MTYRGWYAIKQNSNSLSFETYNVILLNVTNDGDWKSYFNLLYNDSDVA